MRALVKKLNDFDEEHPYLSVLIAAVVGSVIGILIEYVVNGDFVKSGFYGVLFFNAGWLLYARRRVKKKRSSK